MKFTGGYLLGSLTVIGLGVAFSGGIASHMWLMEKKTETITKIADETGAGFIRNYFETRKN